MSTPQAERIVPLFQEGADIASIALTEGLTIDEVEAIIREALRKQRPDL